MKKFSFRLQSVLELRERAEQQAQAALAAALRSVNEAEETLAGLADQRLRTLAALPPDVSFEMRLAARTWADALTRRADEVRHGLELLRQEADARRQAAVAAAAERRAVEKLREHAYIDYLAEMQRQDQLLMDEIASVRHVRAQRQGAG